MKCSAVLDRWTSLLVPAGLACVVMATAIARAEDVAIRPRIVAPAYELTVRADPLLPKGDRPEATAPAGDGKLSVSIQPERKSFPANGPIALTVTLKNVGERSLSLWNIDSLGSSPSLLFVHPATGQQVRVSGTAVQRKDAQVVSLDPGKTVERTIVAQMPNVRPFPRPEPRPIPLPRPLLPKAAAPAIDRQPEKIAAPPVADIAPAGPMIPQGNVRMRLMLEFITPPNAKIANLHVGKLASETIDVEISEPNWRPPQPVPPPGPPANRDQAIKAAHPVAEAALNAAYNPIEPVRPPRVGAWIGDPVGSATVKDRDGGGWIVAWTHTTKGKGHSHHVVIEVAPSGQTTVREVFAGYSNR